MEVIAEEQVKYQIDLINEKIAELETGNTPKENIDEIEENIKGMATVWNTIGGIQKIKDASHQVEELDVSRIISAIQNLANTKVSYEKIPIVSGVEWKNLFTGDKE